MRGIVLRLFKWVTLLAVGVALLAVALIVMAAGVLKFGSAHIANRILANVPVPEDREPAQTAYGIASASGDMQILGGQGLGLNCSIDPPIDWLAFPRKGSNAPISLQMRQPCAFHDYCYRHGSATYGYTQADCDFLLQEHALRTCKFVEKYSKKNRRKGCANDSRKVTLGVRLGGSGSFKRADAKSELRRSTFFEFDPYPTRSPDYTVARVADAPARWRSEWKVMRKALYVFHIRPAATRVTVFGWIDAERRLCTRFELPASFDHISTAPVVVRDGPEGEEWFVWWQRESLTKTDGRLALLAPGRSSIEDWKAVAGGYKEAGEAGCDMDPYESKNLEPASHVTPKQIIKFSELHAVPDQKADGEIELMALTTHSCGPDSKKVPRDTSICILSMKLTPGRPPDTPRVTSRRHQAKDPNCWRKNDDVERQDCDRYRNFVHAPFVLFNDDGPYLLWMRRGKENGEGYTEGVDLIRFGIRSENPTETAAKISEPLRLEELGEGLDPVAVLGRHTEKPVFLSLVASELGSMKDPKPGPMRARWTRWSGAKDEKRAEDLRDDLEASCLAGLDSAWLLRPPVLIPDAPVSNRYTLIFSRLQEKEAPSDGRVLRLKAITIEGTSCHTGSPRLSIADTSALAVPAKASDAQMIVSDIDGDGMLDVVLARGEEAPLMALSTPDRGGTPPR